MPKKLPVYMYDPPLYYYLKLKGTYEQILGIVLTLSTDYLMYIHSKYKYK